MPKRPYPRWQRRHEAVLRWCLKYPGLPLKLCTKETGYSETHVSRIVCSPDFRQRHDAACEAIRQEIAARIFSGGDKM